MRVLSLFDGMSCGMLALQRAGITPQYYYASEVDKYAITVSKKHYPKIRRVGDVTKIHTRNTFIDLIIGGSPCQGFSFAGKQLNFDDPRSKLFFEFVRLLKECRDNNPSVLFLLENVKMRKEYQNVISDLLGVQPIEINSSLVSAQNRRRLYWTNIEGITQPQDKGILLRDILDTAGDGFIKNHGEYESRNDKSMCLNANYHKCADNHGQRTLIGAIKFGRTEEGKAARRESMKNGVDHTPFQSKEINEIDCDKMNTLLTGNGKENLLIIAHQNINESTNNGVTTLNPKKLDGSQTYQQDRIYKTDGKMICLSAELSGRFNISNDSVYYRKLTPVECERCRHCQIITRIA